MVLMFVRSRVATRPGFSGHGWPGPGACDYLITQALAQSGSAQLGPFGYSISQVLSLDGLLFQHT